MIQIMPLHWGEVQAEFFISGLRRTSGRGTTASGGLPPVRSCGPVDIDKSVCCAVTPSMLFIPSNTGKTIQL